MQSRLEDVLKEKEGELKLHQRFLDLRSFCEEHIFPLTDIPLQRHIEGIKEFVERLIPDPRARTQEMFSGEIFVMLCLLYLHDVGIISSYEWNCNDELFDRMEKSAKTIIMNRDIAMRLEIPESAIEIVNSLIFYPTVKRIPLEWEIKEGSSRAIIRNTRALEQVFSFAHLLWDIFSPDSEKPSLRRFQHPNLRLQCGASSVDVDSREGLLIIRCSPLVPYQVHLIEMVKGYVESAFKKFKEGLNGKLGFQYKSILWEIDDVCFSGPGIPERPGPSPFCTMQSGPQRWEEANLALDTLFKNGHVIITGYTGSGKTTFMESYLLGQLSRISANVFHSDVWENPVGELRQAVALNLDDKQGLSDMVSVCSKLRQTGPCFFILDGCERLRYVEEGQREKLKRFVDFCLDTEGLYVVIIGDKEDFFEWYQPFRRMNLSAIFELEPGEGKKDPVQVHDVVSEERLRETLDGIMKKSVHKGDLREVVATLVGETPGSMARCSLSDIRRETDLPLDNIIDCLGFLKGARIIKERQSFNSTHYTVSSRHLVEPLREYLNLSEFNERRRIRAAVNRTCREGKWLSGETLDAVERWIDKVTFDGEEMSLILASAIQHGRSPDLLLARLGKEKRPRVNVRSEMIVRLLREDDAEKRKAAVCLLSKTRDDHMVNELLSHLKREEDRAIKGLILETLIGTGKKKTLVALMRTLSDMDDIQWKLDAIELLASGNPSIARDALLILAENEKDMQVLDSIEKVFSMLEESL